MKPKPTPGPWEFNVSSTNTSRIWLPAIDAGLYLRCDEILDMAPNTRLIAAAPEMLEALKTALRELEHLNKHCGASPMVIDEIEAAIAKAEGWE